MASDEGRSRHMDVQLRAVKQPLLRADALADADFATKSSPPPSPPPPSAGCSWASVRQGLATAYRQQWGGLTQTERAFVLFTNALKVYVIVTLFLMSAKAQHEIHDVQGKLDGLLQKVSDASRTATQASTEATRTLEQVERVNTTAVDVLAKANEAVAQAQTFDAAVRALNASVLAARTAATNAMDLVDKAVSASEIANATAGEARETVRALGESVDRSRAQIDSSTAKMNATLTSLTIRGVSDDPNSHELAELRAHVTGFSTYGVIGRSAVMPATCGRSGYDVTCPSGFTRFTSRIYIIYASDAPAQLPTDVRNAAVSLLPDSASKTWYKFRCSELYIYPDSNGGTANECSPGPPDTSHKAPTTYLRGDARLYCLEQAGTTPVCYEAQCQTFQVVDPTKATSMTLSVPLCLGE